MFEKYLANLSKEFDQFSDVDFSSYSYHTQFLFLYAYYHYFDGDSSKIDEILKGDMTKKETSDNIDGVYLDEEADEPTLNIIISYPKHEIDNAASLFKPAETTLFNALDDVKTRESLKSRLNSFDIEIRKDMVFKIILITDYAPVAKEKKEMLKELKKEVPYHKNVEYKIVFGSEIESEILEIEDPKEYVENGDLMIDSENNLLCYGNERSLIANVDAFSIKKLYEEYGYRGLFAQNLRYYVKNAKIDDSIKNSIQNRPDDF